MPPAACWLPSPSSRAPGSPGGRPRRAAGPPPRPGGWGWGRPAAAPASSSAPDPPDRASSRVARSRGTLLTGTGHGEDVGHGGGRDAVLEQVEAAGDPVEGADAPGPAALDRLDHAADLVIGVLGQRAVQLDRGFGQQR